LSISGRQSQGAVQGRRAGVDQLGPFVFEQNLQVNKNSGNSQKQVAVRHLVDDDDPFHIGNVHTRISKRGADVFQGPGRLEARVDEGYRVFAQGIGESCKRVRVLLETEIKFKIIEHGIVGFTPSEASF